MQDISQGKCFSRNFRLKERKSFTDRRAEAKGEL